MSSNLIVYMIAGITLIVGVLGVFGFPALAIVAVKYFKLKERELTLEMQYREKSQQQYQAIEPRVQRLEEVLLSLDHDVRARLGVERTTPLTSHPSED
jgi:hypothetical protein